MRIYTRAYRPFVMGGSPHYHIAAEVAATDPIDLGRGASVRLVTSPQGKTFVVEAETGAIVGNDLDEVRRDVEEGDPELLAKQIAQARIDSAAAEVLSAEDFWNKMARARS